MGQMVSDPVLNKCNRKCCCKNFCGRYMTPIVQLLAIVIAMWSTIAIAQDQTSHEFLKPIDSQKRSELMGSHALEIKTREFFAKPEKSGIYRYDMNVLEKQGEIITITLFGAPAIELMSHGIWRNPERAGRFANWRISNPFFSKRINKPFSNFENTAVFRNVLAHNY